jgi:plasmid maintenance system killer protein
LQEGKELKNFSLLKGKPINDWKFSNLPKEDLLLLPSNRFESLSGDRQGQYSIRINDKWRICFEWIEEDSEPWEIEIVNYHT